MKAENFIELIEQNRFDKISKNGMTLIAKRFRQLENEAITVTRCSAQLKNKYPLAFTNWIEKNGYKHRLHGYLLKGTDNVHITDLYKYYKNIHNL